MIVSSGSVELGSDEHTFVIRGDAGAVEGVPWHSTLVVVPDDVGATGDVLVRTADQFGPFAVTAELHTDTPLDDPTCEDVVEFTLICHGPLMVAELVNHDPCAVLLTGADTYRVRVSSRGRTDPGLLEDDVDSDPRQPVENYLIQAWPTAETEARVVRETSSWARAQLADPQPEPLIEGREDGLAAAARIGRDADREPGGRNLSGEVEAITLERRVPGTRRKASRWMKYGPTLTPHIPSWSMIAGGRGWDKVGGVVDNCSHGDHPDQLCGSGVIRATLLTDDSPRSWSSAWSWLVQRPDGGTSSDAIESLLLADTTLTATYTQSRDGLGNPQTLVRIHHADLPVEWVDDLTAWWTYQLAVLESILS